MLLWMMLVLVLVIGGMLLLTHFLRRFPGLTQRRGERMAVEETLVLTPKAAVHIIEVEGERRLIGTNEGAIVHLAHLHSTGSTEPDSE
jgi:flagellar biogenesis protein FliO